MAELTTRDRLQPSLLDRLTDDEPDVRDESRDRRMLSMQGLRRAVLRDLGWLFNTTRLDVVQDLSQSVLAARSVINYGLPDLSGKTASGVDIAAVEAHLRQAIWDFEPRVLRETIEVRAVLADQAGGNPNQIVFEISGELWGQPLPERLYLKTELDLEIGEVRVLDTCGSA